MKSVARRLIQKTIGLDFHRFISQDEQRRRDIARQEKVWIERFGAYDSDTWLALIRDFQHVHHNVDCAHSQLEALLIAQFLIESPLTGAMIECGCYKGGSTAKLSLLAKMTSRRLIVCDSFQGLPEPSEQDRLHHWFDSGQDMPYKRGDWAGTLNEVKDHVRRFGAIDHCEFVPGFFSDTLQHLQAGTLSFVFMDVDYISSARDCLRFLWPRLESRGRFFTHEARSKEFIYGITDHEWWRQTFDQCPPLLIGAGFGCGTEAADLAFMDKQ